MASLYLSIYRLPVGNTTTALTQANSFLSLRLTHCSLSFFPSTMGEPYCQSLPLQSVLVRERLKELVHAEDKAM